MPLNAPPSSHPWVPFWHRVHAGSRRKRSGAGGRSRWIRWGGACAAVLFICVLAVLAVRRTTWGGPLLADGLRAIFGTQAVAQLEDSVARATDRWNLFWRRNEDPRPIADMPVAVGSAEPSVAPPPADPSASALRPEFVELSPADVGPLHSSVAAEGDGAWQPIRDLRHPHDSVLLWRTLIHPDKKRPWSELFVVAIDLRRVELFVVAGTREPKTLVARSRDYVRHGLVPERHRDRLLAAFNGGFKAEHGRYGMHVDGVTLIEPRDHACTIAALADGSLRIATWTALAEEREMMTWFRQTPPCLVEDSVAHPALQNEDERRWGAMPDGATVIRRSALGLNALSNVLYMGVSNDTTAGAIGAGMRHAGAANVAELDVNWSFPHFVIFKPSGGGTLKAVGLFEGFLFDPDNYVNKPASRDFFYLVHAEDDV